ncbi:hypothetical protein IQ62_00150 [Streptomyces scabiei]|uniref:hypothetical protein n=1 Tax=Streptomyces scabiei TaxID=1930 RepID=UPI0004E6A0ED|nr:hypothetical protein [Streptomyces scabiei]KFG02755.1 hypothetical protein IQ62_00150 [Streptomyces scabiei]
MALNADIQAWLLAQLGETTSVTDLETRYTRLGTARAVALEVLRGRLAALLQQPSTVTVSSVVGIGTSENIKALERQIASLEAGVPRAPDDPLTTDTDTVPEIGVAYLVERRRR